MTVVTDSALPIPQLKGVRRQRALYGLTQGDLAEAAGLSRQQVGLIESGRVDPRLSSLVALADALGCELVEILGDAA